MSLTQNEAQNQMVECPYDKSHRMLRKRLQQHLLKCRVNHPDVELQTCPFNKTHLIPEPEFVHHVTNCSDRKLITQYKYDAPVSSYDDELDRVKQEPIQCDENWDDTEVIDYDPRKYVERANVLRQPDMVQPAARKAFIKNERKRLGDYNSDDEREEEKKNIKRDWDKPDSSDEEVEYVYKTRRLMTPPPPPGIAWFEDIQGRSELNKDSTTSNHEKRKHKKHRHRSRSSREEDHSPNRDCVQSRRSDNYSPEREHGHSRRSDNYSPNRERQQSKRYDNHILYSEIEKSRRVNNDTPNRIREQSRQFNNYSPVRERVQISYDNHILYSEIEKSRRVNNDSPNRIREQSRQFHNYSPVRERVQIRHFDNYSPNRHRELIVETEHNNDEDDGYSLDEDPYYNGTGSSQYFQQNYEQIQYPFGHLHRRGSHRGHTYLGSVHGRYERPFHEY